MKRASLFAAIALTAAALAGFGIGYVAGRKAHPRGLEKVTLLGVSRSLLLDSLNLTARQHRVVDSVLKVSETRAATSIEGMMQSVKSTTRDAREAIRSVLDSNQRAKLDSILNRVPELKPRSPMPPKEMRQ